MKIKRTKNKKVVTISGLGTGQVFAFVSDVKGEPYMKIYSPQNYNCVRLRDGILFYCQPDHELIKLDVTLVID